MTPGDAAAQNLTTKTPCPCLVLAAVLGIRGATTDGAWKWTVWVPALLLLVGAVLGLVLDAANRAAAAVPMSLGTFASIVIVGALVLLFTTVSKRG